MEVAQYSYSGLRLAAVAGVVVGVANGLLDWIPIGIFGVVFLICVAIVAFAAKWNYRDYR